MGDEGADHLPIHMNLEHKQEIALRKDLEPENLFVGELQNPEASTWRQEFGLILVIQNLLLSTPWGKTISYVFEPLRLH